MRQQYKADSSFILFGKGFEASSEAWAARGVWMMWYEAILDSST